MDSNEEVTAQAGAGQGSGGHGQWRAGLVADAAQPRRRVRAADPPAGSGIWAPPLPRQRRRDCDLPAGRTDVRKATWLVRKDTRRGNLSANPDSTRTLGEMRE
jgi:hypothetical protein